MAYFGGGHYGIERCPVCGYTMLNGICYNTEGHRNYGIVPSSPNSSAGELGMAVGKLVRKWWDNRQAKKKKQQELDDILGNYYDYNNE